MPEQKSEILGEGYGNPSPNGEHIICGYLDDYSLRIVAGKVATIYLGDAKEPIARVRYDNQSYDAYYEVYAFGVTEKGQLIREGSTLNSGVYDLEPYRIHFGQFLARVRGEQATWATSEGPSLIKDHIVIKSTTFLAPLRVVITDHKRLDDTIDLETIEPN